MKKDKMIKLENTHYKVKRNLINYLLFTILFLFFAYGGMYGVTGFSLGLEKVKAVGSSAGNCHFAVEDNTINGNSVVIAWYCTDGEKINGYTFYDSKGNRIKWFDDNDKHDKSDRLLISGFKNNKEYKVEFKTKKSKKTGEVKFKTNSNGASLDEKLKDNRTPSPYVWFTDATSEGVTIHWRGFGDRISHYDVYNDSGCNNTVGDKYRGPISSVADHPQIGSIRENALKENQCYIIQIKFNEGEIIHMQYNTKTNSIGDVSSSKEDNNYMQKNNSDSNWASSDAKSNVKNESNNSVKGTSTASPTIGNNNNFICKEGDTLGKKDENGEDILTFRGLLKKYWSWVLILVPAALLVFISYDFIKSMISNDSDALKKSSTNALKRVIAGLMILLAPWFVQLIMGWFGLTFCLY